MIIEFTEKYIRDISEAQVFSWREAFKGILSDKLLSNLDIEEFESNWKKILTQKERTNLIWLNAQNTAIGFISFGKPKDKNDAADFEIYGIYVHPNFLGKKHWLPINELCNCLNNETKKFKPYHIVDHE